METKVISCSYFVNDEIEKMRFGVSSPVTIWKNGNETSEQKAVFIPFKQAINVLKRDIDLFIYDDLMLYLENAKSYEQICDLFIGCNIVISESVENVEKQDENNNVVNVEYYNYSLENIVICDNTLKRIATYLYYGSLSDDEKKNVNRNEIREKISKYIEENRA